MKTKLISLAGAVLLSAALTAAPAAAQSHGGHARGGHVATSRGHVGGGYYGGHGWGYAGHGYRLYSPYWYGFGWAPWGAYLGPGYYWGPGYYGPAYGYYGDDTGGLKLKIEGVDHKLAQVSVNGGYVGTVDDFDGVFQQLDLEPGNYRVDVTAPGYRTLEFNVHIQPGKTITYRGNLQPGS